MTKQSLEKRAENACKKIIPFTLVAGGSLGAFLLDFVVPYTSEGSGGQIEKYIITIPLRTIVGFTLGGAIVTGISCLALDGIYRTYECLKYLKDVILKNRNS